ncbi:MAG: Ig-like domain-containing protein [Crocosphaera sp.]|nr:Ig-like domain-containing protein [Crocosphaera sp.]
MANSFLNLSELDGNNGFVLNGIDSGDGSGFSVSSAGDVNGDGFDDLIIGAPDAEPNGNSYAGESYVVFGSGNGFNTSLDLSNLDGSNGFVLNGIDSGDGSGVSVSGAGDVNGDGFDDLIIGAFGADPNGNLETGESYVVFGSGNGFNASLNLSTLNGSNGFVLNGIGFGDLSGWSVSGAGDVNADGFDDLIIGAFGADPNGNLEAGESYVVFGSGNGFNASLNLSTLNGSNGFVLNGIDIFDYSGFSVSSAGDVNGDGFDDLIIGAPDASPNGNSFAGESYVVFGSGNGFNASLNLSTLDGSNGFVLNGIDSGDGSGVSVSSAGDVNGDGFDDIIIGATRSSPNGNSYAGESYVVFGSGNGFNASLNLSTLDGSNGFVLNGIDGSDLSGWSVSGAGDVNGDGFDDLIIGAFGADSNGNFGAGESYVVFGGTSFNDLNENFVPTAINLDNNNIVENSLDDTIVGTLSTTDANGDDTHTYTLLDDAEGRFALDGNQLIVADGSLLDFETATSHEITVRTTDSTGLSFEEVLTIEVTDVLDDLPPTAISFLNGFVLNGIDSFDESGDSVSGAGDVNGDGFDDLIIGALFADPNGNRIAGETYVVFGSNSGFSSNLDLSTLDGTKGFVINGINSFDRSGYSASSAGDINGDGFDDIIIGAPTANSNSAIEAGETYVVFGSNSGFNASLDPSTLDGTNGFILNGIDLRDGSGGSVSGAGDVNGDGFDDIIIGARRADPNGIDGAGETYVVFGSGSGFSPSFDLSTLDGSNGFVLNGIDSSDFSGWSVSSAGDVNGDGFDDLIIGARGADPNGIDGAGETYVVFGSDSGFNASLDLSTLDGTNGFVLNGIDSDDESGRSVSGAGDVNGDGFDDIIIGARRADPNGIDSAGESYVVFGSGSGFNGSLDLSTLDGTNGFVLNGIDSDDESGRSVSGAGDVNGDGFDDIIIGAYRADPNGTNRAGETYVVFGSNGGFNASLDLSSLDGTNGFVLNGIDSDDFSGWSVSGSGDVNGDGFDDIIIGARGADPNSNSFAGETYVVFGGSKFGASIELSNLSSDTTNINENSANGTFIADLSSTDVNSFDTHTYTLLDDAQGRFAINGTQLIVADGSLLDFETATFHEITVRSTDSKGLSFEQGLTVLVNDVSEPSPPTAINLDNNNIAENSFNNTIVGTLTTTDADEDDTHIYTLLDDAEGRFALNGNQVIVADGSLLDFEIATSHEITVRTTDSTGLSFEEVLTIELSDVVDDLPPTAISFLNGFVLNGIDSFDSSGGSVSGAGDINGDGFDDIIIGARGASPNGNSSAGESYVVFGSDNGFNASLDLSTLDGSNGFVLNGIDIFDFSGRSVSSAGDINGDGFDDIIIGAPYASLGGETYVVFGSNTGFNPTLDLSSLDGSNGFVLNGIDSRDESGFSVSSAGDINGDGFDDIIIGAPDAGPLGVPVSGYGYAYSLRIGESYVIFGSGSGFSSSLDLSSLDGSNGFVLNGIDRLDRSGFSVSSAGDINGDGFDDIIIGAPNAGLGGETYVVFGSNTGFNPTLDLSSLDGSNGFVLNGLDFGDESGFSVSGAGDVNGDGFDDIIIGAPDVGLGGETYVVFGSNTGFNPTLDLSTLDGSNGFVLNNIEFVSFFRVFVSGAGDVNGDGFDDIIIGAPDVGFGGETYVVFGSNTGFNPNLDLSSLDGSNGFFLNGINELDNFGGSVSGAGDVNGDGFDDIIIGAPNASPNDISDAGESYVVFGRSSFGASIELSNLSSDTTNINENSANGTIIADLSSTDIDLGDTHTYTLLDDAEGRFAINGTKLIVADGSLLDFETATSHEITVRSTDSKGLSFEQGLTVLVNDVNDQLAVINNSPVANNDEYITDEETVINDDFLSNDDDLDNDLLTITEINGSIFTEGNPITLESGALLTINNDGTFSYDPNSQFDDLDAGETATDSFTYTITDGTDSDTATVNLTINGITSPPFSIDVNGTTINYSNNSHQSYSNQDISGGISFSDNTAILEGNTWKVLGLNYNLTTETILTFEFKSNQGGEIQGIGFDDDLELSNDKIFNLYGSQDTWGIRDFTYTNINGWQEFQIDLGSFITGDINYLILANDDDANASANSQFRNIVLSENALPPTNNIPVANDDEYITDEETVINDDFLSNDDDLDNDSLTITEINGSIFTEETPITLESGALLTINNDGTFSYDPNSQFDNLDGGETATDSFTYTISDGTDSDTATVNLTINGVETLPITNQLKVTIDGTAISQPLESYGDASVNNSNSVPQDTPEGVVTYNDNGNEVQLENNTWKSLDITGYTVTENTRLSFQFRSQDEAEIQGIGLDNDDDLFNDRNTIFQLYGTQTFANQAFNDYEGLNDPQAVEGWKDYSISLGQYFTGEYDRLVFVNDNDTVDNLGGEAQFRNIVLSEVV